MDQPCDDAWKVEAVRDGRLLGTDEVLRFTLHASSCAHCTRSLRELDVLASQLAGLPAPSVDLRLVQREKRRLLQAADASLTSGSPGLFAGRGRAWKWAVGLGIAASVLSAGAALVGGRGGEAARAAPLEILASASGPGAIVASEGARAPLVGERALPRGARLIVGSEVLGAHLALSTGTRLSIDPGGDLTVVEKGKSAVFSLRSGSLRAEVAKLAGDERFVVQTGDAEVEVRGTSFRVSVVSPLTDCGEGVATRVEVYEGLVAVRWGAHVEMVSQGEPWPRGCARASDERPAAGAVDVLEPPVVPHENAGRAARSSPPSPSPPRGEPSHLAEQNDQFSGAMSIKRRGDALSAIAAFDRFLAKYPASHLAENAAAERMRLLSTVDADKARAAAKLYLSKYPAGFARADALSIAAVSAR